MRRRRWSVFARSLLVLALMFPAVLPAAIADDRSVEPTAAVAPMVEGVIDTEVVIDAPEEQPATVLVEPEAPPVAQVESLPVVEPVDEDPVVEVEASTLEPLAIEQELESLEIMPLAISTPGYYEVGDDAVPLTVYVDATSTNTHTMPVVLWSNGDTLYVAVKSTHYLQWMTLQGVLNTGMDEYDPWVPIYVDEVGYDPTGLTGNTNSSHWTVFSGPISTLDLSQPLTYSYHIKGIGVGHDVWGTFDVEPPSVSVDLRKVWDGGLMPDVTVNLMRRVGTGAGVLVSTHTLTSANPSIAVADLPYTDSAGRNYTYYVTEPNPPAGYAFSYTATFDAATMAWTIVGTNSFSPPLIDIVGRKVWSGGPATRPAVELQLYQDGVPYLTSQWTTEHVFTVTWNDVPATDADGTPYTYSVEEVAVPTNYTMSKDDALTVRNTFDSPKIDITGTKTWVGGPVGDRQVELQLYREGDPFGDPVLVTEGEGAEASYTWSVDQYDSDGEELHYRVDEVVTPTNYIRSNPDDFTVVNTYTPPLIDIVGRKLWDGGQGMNFPVTLQLTADGIAFGDPVTLAPRQATYTWEGVAETTLDGTPIAYAITEPNPPANYHTEQVDALTIRNVYTPPLHDFTGYKVWVGGSTVRTDIELQLYEGITPFGEPVTLPAGEGSYTWEDIPATDHNGLPLSYWIDEVEVPAGFSKELSLDGATVTNTYASDEVNVTGRKLWSGGPEVKPDVQLQLLRNGVAFGDPVTVAGDSDGYTWMDLDRTDGEGVPYTYTIDEPVVPENYVKEIAPGGLTILNTYVSPKIDVTASKEWVGGPSVKPDVKLQLFRDGQPVGAPVIVVGGEVDYTWAGLDQNDVNGVAYVYTVDEVDVPADYVKSVGADGLTITNTYVSPKIDVTGTKVWVGGSSPRPTIQMQLFRDGVALGAPVPLADGVTRHTWIGLPKTDSGGRAYVYAVSEVAVPEGYTATLSADGLTLTNTAIPAPPEPPKPPARVVKVPPKANPKTGDAFGAGFAALALAGLGAAGIALSRRRKDTNC